MDFQCLFCGEKLRMHMHADIPSASRNDGNILSVESARYEFIHHILLCTEMCTVCILLPPSSESQSVCVCPR